MITHRLQDSAGHWHGVTRSTSKPGAYVSFHKGTPDRLWFPGQYVKVIAK